MTKQFIFLYPIPEIIDFELSKYLYGKPNKDELKGKYQATLNKCIDARYRQNGFGINYAVFNGSAVSDVIELQPLDRIIEVGLDFKAHTTKQPSGKYPYPDESDILKKLGDVNTLRIGGFHMCDCVEKLAEKAYEKGLNVLVDEDLTEYFPMRMNDSDFRIDKYIVRDLKNCQRDLSDVLSEISLKARKGKPWLCQH